MFARLALGLPALWMITEWLRGTVFTGFPWLASGYAHTDGPLAGWAPTLGMYGITLVAALLAGALSLLTLRERQHRRAATVGSRRSFVLVIGGGWLGRTQSWTSAGRRTDQRAAGASERAAKSEIRAERNRARVRRSLGADARTGSRKSGRPGRAARIDFSGAAAARAAVVSAGVSRLCAAASNAR